MQKQVKCDSQNKSCTILMKLGFQHTKLLGSLIFYIYQIIVYWGEKLKALEQYFEVATFVFHFFQSEPLGITVLLTSYMNSAGSYHILFNSVCHWRWHFSNTVMLNLSNTKDTILLKYPLTQCNGQTLVTSLGIPTNKQSLTIVSHINFVIFNSYNLN